MRMRGLPWVAAAVAAAAGVARAEGFDLDLYHPAPAGADSSSGLRSAS